VAQAAIDPVIELRVGNPGLGFVTLRLVKLGTVAVDGSLAGRVGLGDVDDERGDARPGTHGVQQGVGARNSLSYYVYQPSVDSSSEI